MSKKIIYDFVSFDPKCLTLLGATLLWGEDPGYTTTKTSTVKTTVDLMTGAYQERNPSTGIGNYEIKHVLVLPDSFVENNQHVYNNSKIPVFKMSEVESLEAKFIDFVNESSLIFCK